MSGMSSRQSMGSIGDFKSNSVGPSDIIRNCIIYALESSSSDDLLKCLAGSEWTREYALCRVGEILQEHLRPLSAQISKDGFGQCKHCKEKDKIIETQRQKAESRANSNVALNTSNKTLVTQLEEAVYMRNSMEHQIGKLKEELHANAEQITDLKKDRHRLEVEMGQLEKKLIEASTKYQKVAENTDKVFLERDQVQSESEKIEKLYKNERRKAANLERELEQIQYSHEQLKKNSSAEQSSLRDHINLLKADNLSLQSQVSGLTAELGSKVEDGKKETTKIIKKLKDLECQFDGLKVINETLEQKIEFYKAQLLHGNTGTSAVLAKEVLHEEAKKILNAEDSVGTNSNKGPNHPFESFSSFNNRKIKELNLEVRDSMASDFGMGNRRHQMDKANDRLRSENERLKVKLSTLLMQVKHLRELVKVEASSSKQEIIAVKTILVKSLDTLAHKVRIGFRRNRILKGDKGFKTMEYSPAPALESQAKYVKYSEDRKENIDINEPRKHQYAKSPRRQYENTPSYPIKTVYRREQIQMSPIRNQVTNKRAIEISPSRSTKKLHTYGKPDTGEDIDTRDFRFTSPARSPGRSSMQYFKHSVERRATGLATHGHRKSEWEAVGDDLMHHLQRNH